MKSKKTKSCAGFSDAFYGSSTIGERGQIVIPAEARADIGFQPGEKVLIMRHPAHAGLMIFKLEAVREFLDEFASNLSQIEAARESLEEVEK